MQRIGKGYGKTVEMYRAASITHIDLRHALGGKPCGEIGIGKHRRARFASKLDGIPT